MPLLPAKATFLHSRFGRRPLLSLVCLLLFATSLVLYGLAQEVTPPVCPEMPAGTANLDLVRAFYAATNDVLAGGDTAPLDRFLAAGFVEHPPRPGTAGSSGFVQSLLDRRAVFPGLRLVVDDLRSTGADAVTARIHTEGGASTGSFLGLPVPAHFAAWGPVELLRISEHRIVERWGGDTSQFAPLWTEPFPTGVPAEPQVVALRRVSWDPGAVLAVEQHGATWFLTVEVGSLEIAVDAMPSSNPIPTTVRHREGDLGIQEAIVSSRPAPLASGDLLAVAPLTGFSLTNRDTVPATALLVAVWAPSVRTSATKPTDEEQAWDRRAVALGLGSNVTGAYVVAPGVTGQVLTTAQGVPIPAGAQAALGRMTLAPGATLVVPGGARAMVLTAEAGSLHLMPEAGDAWGIGEDGHSRLPDANPRLATGAGAVVTTGTAGTWRAGDDGTAALLVLVLAPPAE